MERLRFAISTAALSLLAAVTAHATPIPTGQRAGCGHLGLSKYGQVATCSSAGSSFVDTSYAIASSCVALPAGHLTRTGQAVAYAGSSITIDGSGTFQFFGGPPVATLYGSASFGEQRWANPVFGPLIRWGNFNYVTNRFYPSSEWLADQGAVRCSALKAPTPTSGCTSHCSPAQNANTIVAKGLERGARGLDLLTMVGIAACESNLQDSVTSPTSNRGLFQFGDATWRSARGRYFGGVLGNPYNALDNAATAGAAVANAGFGPWDRPANPSPDPYLRYLYGEIRTPPSGCRQALITAGFGGMAGPN